MSMELLEIVTDQFRAKLLSEHKSYGNYRIPKICLTQNTPLSGDLYGTEKRLVDRDGVTVNVDLGQLTRKVDVEL